VDIVTQSVDRFSTAITTKMMGPIALIALLVGLCYMKKNEQK
jgi:hypothetical protein